MQRVQRISPDEVHEILCGRLCALGVFALKNLLPSVNSQPRTGDAAVAARGATARRVRRGALEDKVTRFATRGFDDQPLPSRPNAALDVANILLQHFNGEAEFAAKIVELPLALSQSFDDLLTSGLSH